MSFLEQMLTHYNQTKLAILEAVQNKIADEYPELKDAMEIKRGRLEINSDVCNCYIDIEYSSFKICFDGHNPYYCSDMQILLDDIRDEIDDNKC